MEAQGQAVKGDIGDAVEMTTVKISDIAIDMGIQLQSRSVHSSTVTDYVEALTNGDNLPPVTIFDDGDSRWLADGFHRVQASQFLGLVEIEAEIQQGTRQDAMVFAATANVMHGRPMSQNQKKEAGLRLLELTDWSQREIARRLAVSHTVVQNWASSGKILPDRPTTVTRNGSTYEMDTSAIGQPSTESIPDDEPTQTTFEPDPEPEKEEYSNTHTANFMGASNDGNRPDDDNTPTPPGATLALLRSGVMDVQEWGRVWEPCCGAGWMSEVLVNEGYEVYSSNLVDHGYGETNVNFFECDDLPLGYKSIITNPPYRPMVGGQAQGVEAFIAHALSMPSLKRLALLLPTLKLQGQGRRDVLGVGSGFRYLIQFHGRIKFHRGGVKPDYVKSDSPMGVHAWYVWDVGYSWRPEIVFVDEVT